jgi:hypothetical protein
MKTLSLNEMSELSGGAVEGLIGSLLLLVLFVVRAPLFLL